MAARRMGRKRCCKTSRPPRNFHSVGRSCPATALAAGTRRSGSRAAWERVGGYEERLDAAEDTYLVLAMRRAGLRFVFEPRAVVRCWTPANVREAFRTSRQYATSDGRARRLGTPQTHYGRLFGTYGAGVVLLILGIWWPISWIVLFAGALAYVVYRVRKVLEARLLAMVPYSVVVALAVDLAQILGYAQRRTHPIEGDSRAAAAGDPSNDP